MNAKYQSGALIFLPERPSDLPRLLSRTFETLHPDLLRALTKFVKDPTPEAIHPGLVALGIMHQATPPLCSKVTRQKVRHASCAEARQALAERGIDLDEKTVRTLSLKIGAEALEQR